MNSHLHFEGKDALSHVKEARVKGKGAFSEMHGKEVPTFFYHIASTAKETIILFSAFYLFFSSESLFWSYFFVFAIIWALLRMVMIAHLGWSRLERLHNLIEEERWEIEHHRSQEREELTALYQAKGFSGKLLEQVIDILMGDDNRLLQIMLEEELGLTLEAFEHPLKQSFGAFLGCIISALIFSLSYYLPIGVFIFSPFIVLISTLYLAKKEKRNLTVSLLWNLGAYVLILLSTFFLLKWVL